jgi:hypothetical protein
MTKDTMQGIGLAFKRLSDILVLDSKFIISVLDVLTTEQLQELDVDDFITEHEDMMAEVTALMSHIDTDVTTGAILKTMYESKGGKDAI